jgi:PhnB protein
MKLNLNPYLFFNGNCEEALNFYQRVLGAQVDFLTKHAGSPAEAHVPKEWGDKVLHARFTIGDTVLMASDAPPGRQADKPQGFSVNINVPDVASGERIFRALADGGSVTMPFAKTFWADGYGMLTDRFGIPWMVNCQPARELEKTA